MKKQLLIFSLILFAGGLLAQEVSKQVVVEHFTNSRCGICANRNPGLYQNLDNNPDVIHLAVHPSRPYSTCLFQQHNPSENDARTNYHGVFGSTPRIVVQGVSIASSANYGNPEIFTSQANETTPVSIELYQVKENNQLQVDVVLRAEVDNSIGTAKLFLAAAEQLVNYNAPNGENQHRDVFRRTFTGEPTGIALSVPATAGEEFVARYSVMADASWVFEEMFVVAILNDATDRSVIQAAATDPDDNAPLVNTQNLQPLELELFPNPVRDRLDIQLPQEVGAAQVRLLDLSGKLVLEQMITSRDQLQLAHLPSGSYWLEVRSGHLAATKQVIKE
jgi:hypothetical protein